jgi:hypothetical protein
MSFRRSSLHAQPLWPTLTATMTPAQRLIAQKFFELEVRRNKGSAFQDLFNRVMERRFPDDFVPIRPYGKMGDRKNDGYVRSCGRFYQVYAPLNAERNEGTAATKAEKDFAGLLAHSTQEGRPVREFRFAFNDDYRGLAVPLDAALVRLEQTHGIPCKSFLAKDLEAAFLELPDDKMQDILGMVVPDIDILPTVNYDAVREVVNHVMNSAMPTIPNSRLLAPDFDEKIRFNGLSEGFAHLLRTAAYQADVLTDYFALRAGSHRQDLRDHLAFLYEQQRNAHGETADADVVFAGVLTVMIPSAHRVQAVVNAALVIMAYYFEACDVFEVPRNAAT